MMQEKTENDPKVLTIDELMLLTTEVYRAAEQRIHELGYSGYQARVLLNVSARTITGIHDANGVFGFIKGVD
ncbi:TPA: hypothetical protein H2869_003066 [Salmonella enterica]|nr:hypothetical protein [Salmonella enterica]